MASIPSKRAKNSKGSRKSRRLAEGSEGTPTYVKAIAHTAAKLTSNRGPVSDYKLPEAYPCLPVEEIKPNDVESAIPNLPSSRQKADMVAMYTERSAARSERGVEVYYKQWREV
ncbi:MAG: hypothetical protein LQ338_007302, partial [Usnochroma carphineum]